MLDKVKKDLRQREFASNDDQTSSLCHKHGSIDASAIFFRLSRSFFALSIEGGSLILSRRVLSCSCPRVMKRFSPCNCRAL